MCFHPSLGGGVFRSVNLVHDLACFRRKILASFRAMLLLLCTASALSLDMDQPYRACRVTIILMISWAFVAGVSALESLCNRFCSRGSCRPALGVPKEAPTHALLMCLACRP